MRVHPPREGLGAERTGRQKQIDNKSIVTVGLRWTDGQAGLHTPRPDVGRGIVAIRWSFKYDALNDAHSNLLVFSFPPARRGGA